MLFYFIFTGIPMLVIIDAEGKLITTEGRGSVMQDPEGKNFPWYPPACCELDSFSASIVNEGPCLILFTEIEEGDDDEYSCKALEMMKPVAEEIRAAEEAKGKEPACKFIVAGDVMSPCKKHYLVLKGTYEKDQGNWTVLEIIFATKDKQDSLKNLLRCPHKLPFQDERRGAI
nr:nucleoredoxin-like [Lytechinus pictus]